MTRADVRSVLLRPIVVLAVLCWGRIGLADQIDLALGAGPGSGVSLGSSDEGSVIHRTPTFVAFDFAGRLDIYPGWEVACGVVLPVEQTPAVGVTPQIRRVTRLWLVDGYLGLGAPMFLAPFTLYGGEVSLGARYRILGPLQAFATASADVFLAGSDVPVDGTLLMFNFVAGARVDL